MDNQISSVTRRDLFDEIIEKRFRWHGRLNEILFLNRIYNLEKMPSTDDRYSNAEDDIWQHRERNFDWEDWWILSDPRFDLLYCPDDGFLKFICEMIHPSVRTENEVNEILPIINKYLNKDNFELFPKNYISGRPVFGYRKIDGIKHKTIENVKTIKDYLSSEYIDKQIQTIEAAIDNNPTLAIGTAKELIETICIAILEKNDVEISKTDKDDLPKILKKTLNVLQLLPENIDNNKKGVESIKKILGGLITIVQGLAELRNVYGTGHGKSANFKGLQPKHAKLAVNAASIVAYFLLEAHNKKKNNKMKLNNKKPIIPKLRFPEFQNSGEWKVKRLGEVFNLQDGYSFSSKDFSSEENDESYQVVRITEINNKNKNEDKVYISSETAKKIDLECFKIIKGDLLLSLTGAAGFNFFIWKDNKKAFLNQRTLKLIPKDENNDSIKYLAEPLLFKKINSLGTGQNNNLSKSILEQIKIPLPSLPEQQKIASCLSSIDEVIAGERQRLELLKAHKKGLLQNLFPREGETVPKLRFPEFENNGEWEETILGQVADYENGKAHEQDIEDIGDFIVVNSKFISSDGEVKKYTNTAFCPAQKGDILMVLSDVPNGKAIAKCFLVEEDNRYTVNQRICRITPRNLNSNILYYLLNRNPYFISFDDGVKQTNLRKEDVLNCPLLISRDSKEQEKIAEILTTIDDIITTQCKKIEALQQHKKGLLQGLFPQGVDTEING